MEKDKQDDDSKGCCSKHHRCGRGACTVILFFLVGGIIGYLLGGRGSYKKSMMCNSSMMDQNCPMMSGSATPAPAEKKK